MTDDPRALRDTDDLPDAVEAFGAARAVRRDEDAVSVSRATALLTLVRPRHLEQSEYRVVTEEARELIGVESIEPLEPGREELAAQLQSLGESGARAARHMLSEVPDEPVRGLSATDRAAVDAAQSEAATELFQGARELTGPDPAAKLIAASLLDEDPLVQVAAAAAALRVDRKNPVAEAILDRAARESDETAELSRAILTNDRRDEARVVEIEYPPGERDPAADSTLVHGTWARSGRWWQPTGDLYSYLRDEARLFPHLYRGTDPFKWSGYFAFRAWKEPKVDWNRRQAADSLAWWAHRRLTPEPDLIGHSYGGSLSMMATAEEKRVRGLILLSPAVHHTCLPDPANYEQILHVRMKLDLVLLADLSAPWLLRPLPRVTERVVKRRGLIGHSTTHDPRVWRESGLADHVRDAWLPSLGSRA